MFYFLAQYSNIFNIGTGVVHSIQGACTVKKQAWEEFVLYGERD
jgi:hypothetical protein